MMISRRFIRLPRPLAAAWLLLPAAWLLLPAACGRHAGQEQRPPRTSNLTLHFVSQSGLQGEVVPCG